MIQINLQNRKRLTDLENELMIVRGMDGGDNQSSGMDMYTLFYLEQITNQQGATISYLEFCSMLCGSIDGRGVWGRVDMCICMAESFHCPPETVTILLICYSSTHTHTHTHTHTNCASSARGVSSNPGWGIKIPCAAQQINRSTKDHQRKK